MCALYLHFRMTLTLLLLVAVPVSLSSRQERDEWTTRYSDLHVHWKCRHPKPRLLYLADEKPNYISPHLLWSPPAVVLHRCDNTTGCCFRSTLACTSNTTQEVSVVFKKHDRVAKRETFERIRFLNHTSCSCQESL